MLRFMLSSVGIYGLYKCYKIYNYNTYKKYDYPRQFFLVSRDIVFKNYICEIGHTGITGSFLRIKNKEDERELVFSKLNNTIDDIDKDGIIVYNFEGDIKLTFKRVKNEEDNENEKDKNYIYLCLFERDGEVIEEDVTRFINEYRPISFNTDFDLLKSFRYTI